MSTASSLVRVVLERAADEGVDRQGLAVAAGVEPALVEDRDALARTAF